METIGTILVRGHKVIFFENENGEVDFHLETPVPDELFHEIVCYLIDEGIFEQFCDLEDLSESLIEILQERKAESEDQIKTLQDEEREEGFEDLDDLECDDDYDDYDDEHFLPEFNP